MDCFYAQVEMRDDPSLKGRPVAVGGLPGTRSVLCTANYEARKFGVRSAMPTDLAVKKCKDLVVIPPHFSKYKEASEIIHQVFAEYTDKIEPLSLDEAFLDVSHEANASLLIKDIQRKIFERTQLTSSVGLAPNKFLAKIASDWNKPNGLFIIRPHEVNKFVHDLEVKCIPGVGAVSLKTLNDLKIKTCGDLLKVDATILTQFFGKFAQDLLNYAHGIDDRDVVTEWERKSLSVESTFLKDHYWSDELEIEFHNILAELHDRLMEFLADEPEKSVKKIFVKAKYNDFTKRSKETIIPKNADFNTLEYKNQFLSLLSSLIVDSDKPVRLIGLGVRFHTSDVDEVSEVQLPLFNPRSFLYGT